MALISCTLSAQYGNSVLLKSSAFEGLTMFKKSVSDSEMLQNCLRTAIRTKHWGMEPNSVAMLHNNVCVHNAIQTADPLQKLNFMVSKYHLYSPQLLPLDYCGFGSIQRHLKSILHQWSTFARSSSCIAGQPIKKTFFFFLKTYRNL